jgi:hypothetical protein
MGQTLVATGITNGGGGTDEATFATAHAKLLADRTIQFDLPAYHLPQPPAWLEPVIEFFKAIAPAFKYIFWGAAIIGAAIILFIIVQEMRGVAWRWPWRRKPTEIEEDTEWRPAAGPARELLREADALAAAGHFAEAARLLLHRSVEDLVRRRPDFVRPSLTSRDIAAAQTLPSGARAAFAAIARVVETSLFGRSGVDEEAWRRCRDAYHDFAFAGSWT